MPTLLYGGQVNAPETAGFSETLTEKISQGEGETKDTKGEIDAMVHEENTREGRALRPLSLIDLG